MNRYSNFYRIVCAIVALVMCVNLLPAAPIATEREEGRLALEYWLERAERVRSSERWDSLTKEGLLAAMCVWESANFALKENGDAWKKARSEAEEFYQSEIARAFTKWTSARWNEEGVAEKRNALAEALRNEAAVWNYIDEGDATREVAFKDAEAAKAKWLSRAGEIVADYYRQWQNDNAARGTELMRRLSTVKLSIDEKELIINKYNENYTAFVQTDYANVLAAASNVLMNELLYDQHSIRKLSDKEAAAVIARQLARDAEKETDANLNALIGGLGTELESGDESGVELERKNWYAKFEKALEKSLQKWDDAERGFLQARVQWEQNAEQVYRADDAVWADAYRELSERRKAWNQKIRDRINAIRATFDEREKTLKIEISVALANYAELLQRRKSDYEKNAELQKNNYTTYRTMMKMCADGIDTWYEHWGEKYNGLYSYWKSEDANTFNKYFSRYGEMKNTYLYDAIDAEKVKTQLKNWNEAYKAMLIREINKKINAQENLIKNHQKKITELNSRIADIKEHRGHQWSYRERNARLQSLQNELATANKWLDAAVSLNNTIKGWREKINKTNADSISDILKKDDFLKSIYEIVRPVETLAGERYAALWDTGDMISGSDRELSEWIRKLFGYDEKNETGEKIHKAGYRDNAIAAMKNLYLLTGSTFSQDKDGSSYMDELENEVLKAQALKQYWDDELSVARQVVYYVNTRTSDADWENESRQKLNEAIDYYSEKKSAYDKAVEKLETKRRATEDTLDVVNAAFSTVAEAKATLEEAQKKYTAAQAAYNGMGVDAAARSVQDILSTIRYQKNTNEKKAWLDEYCGALKIYADMLFMTQRLEMISRLMADGADEVDTLNGMFSNMEHDEAQKSEHDNMTAQKAKAERLREELDVQKVKRERSLAIEYIRGTYNDDAPVASEEMRRALYEEAYKETVGDVMDVELSADIKALVDVRYEKKLFDAYGDSMLIETVKKQYGAYRVDALNQKNVAAHAAISELMTRRAFVPDRSTVEELVDYINELYEVGNDLNIVESETLDLYVSELVKETAQKANNTYTSDSLVALDTAMKAHESFLQTLLAWTSSIQSEAGLVEILVDEEFAKLAKSGAAEMYAHDAIVAYAAALFLPRVNDFSSADSIEAALFENENSKDNVLAVLSKNVVARRLIAEEIYNLYAKETERLPLSDETKAIKMWYAAGQPEDTAPDSIKRMKKAQVAIAAYIADSNETVADKVDDEDIKGEEYIKENEWNEKIINNKDYLAAEWFPMYLAGRDVLYAYLCEHLDITLVREVNEFFAGKGEIPFADLTHYVAVVETAQRYDYYSDGDIDVWLEKQDKSLRNDIRIFLFYDEMPPLDYYAEERRAGFAQSVSLQVISQAAFEKTKDALDMLRGEVEKKSRAYLIELIYASEIVRTEKEKVAFDSYAAWVKKHNDEIIAKKENGTLGVADRMIELDFTYTPASYESAAYASFFTDGNVITYDELKIESDDIATMQADTMRDLQKSQEVLLTQNAVSSNDRVMLIDTLDQTFSALTAIFDDAGSKRDAINKTYTEMTEKERDYDTACTARQIALETYSELCDEYNVEFNVTDLAYNELEEARLIRRAIEEVVEWAENEYLHEDTELRAEAYESPQEKLERVSSAARRATLSYETIVNLKNERYEGSARENDDEAYHKAYDEFGESYKRYYAAVMTQYEMNAAVAEQSRILAQAEADVEAARSALVRELGEGGTYDEAAWYFACVTKESDDYIVSFKRGDEADDKTEYFSTDEVLYYTSNEEAFSIKKARIDAFRWYTKLDSENPERLEKVVLAAMYLETCGNEAQKKSWFDMADDSGGGQKYMNPLDTNRTADELSILPNKFHAARPRSEYLSARSDKLREMYEEVIKNGWEDDIAKYFLYRDNYLADLNAKLEVRAERLLTERALRPVRNTLERHEWTNRAIAISFAATAAALTASAFPFSLWMLVPAAVAAATSAVFWGITNSYKAKRKDVEDIMNSERSNRHAENQKINNLINIYKETEKVRTAERRKLNLLKYGTTERDASTDTDLTYEMFKASLAQGLSTSVLGERSESGSRVKLLDVGTLEKEIYAKSAGQKSMRDLFESVQNKRKKENGGKGYLAIADIIAAMTSVLNDERQANHYALEKRATELRVSQNAAAAAYNQRVRELVFSKSVSNDGAFVGEMSNNSEAGDLEQDEQHIQSELSALANAAWGAGTWREKSHRDKMQKLYNDFIGVKYMNNKNEAEEYMNDSIDNLLSEYVLNISNEANLLYDAKSAELDMLLSDFYIQRQFSEAQIRQILARAEEEWTEAEKKITNAYASWCDKFKKEYDKKSAEWEKGYVDFLARKEAWLVEQYVYAQNVGDYTLLDESGLDAGKEIADALQSVQSAMERDSLTKEIAADTSKWLSTLYDRAFFERIEKSAAALASRAKNAERALRKADKINAISTRQLAAALQTQNDIETEMKTLAARLASQQATLKVERMRQAFMERLRAENSGMEEWELQLVSDNGYRTDGKIRRTTTVDAYLISAKRKEQTVRRYEWFRTAAPDAQVSFGQDDDDITIMRKIEDAQKSLMSWSERIFGKIDGEGVKRHIVARTVAESRQINNYEKSETDDSNVLAYKTLKTNLNKIGKLSDDENSRYVKLQSLVVEIRDGEFGEWLGYAPIFKDSPDFTKSAEKNLAASGRGQIGGIMLDFVWNDMVRSYGAAELAKPPHDRKLWAAGGLIKPPTLRSLTGVVCDIVGNATKHKWISLIDDALFGAIDLTLQYKSPLEVAVDLGKAGVSFGLGAGMGAVAGKVSNVIGNINNAGLKAFTNVGLSMAESYVGSVAPSYINALDVKEGKLSMDWNSANKSLYSAGTVASMLNMGTSVGIRTGFGSAMNTEFNKFYGSLIDFGAASAGKAAEYGTYLAYTKGDFKKAYGDMGGVTFNVANAGALADFFESALARKNATGQTKFGAAAQKLFEKGLVEVNFGLGGISTKFGSSGIDIGGNLYIFAKRMRDKSLLESYARNYGAEKGNAAYKAYVYGDWTQENTAARLALEKDALIFMDEEGFIAQTLQNEKGGRAITIRDNGDAYLNAIQIGHEAYRDGRIGNVKQQKLETQRAVRGHVEMAARMSQDEIKLGSKIGQELFLYNAALALGDINIFNDYVDEHYDSAADYWKMKMYADGTHEIIYDEKKELSIDYLNEDGKVISTSVPLGQDMSDIGMSGALGKIIGIERAEKLLGANYLNTDLYDDQTLKELLRRKGYSHNDIVRIQRKGRLVGIDLREADKYNFVGEALMKRAGASWNVAKGTWQNTNEISTTITDGVVRGNIMAEVVNGKYWYSTVNATVYRDPRSWKSFVGMEDEDGNVTWKHNDTYSGLDYILYEKAGINWDFHEKYLVGNYQTIDNMVTNSKGADFNQAYYDKQNGRWVQGNTIISSHYNMQYGGTSGSYEGGVLIKNNALTVDGQKIGNDGTSSTSMLRWLEHANRGKDRSADWRTIRSDGCDITTFENQMALMKKLREWNLSKGYQMSTHLLNQAYYLED